MEELVTYDPHLVVGILGGGAGTTYDAFKLLAEARKYGARAALFGRKINHAECQLAFVEFLRRIADGQIEAEEAVRAYHGVLQRLKIKPQRSLADDLTLQSSVMSYGGSSASVPAGMPAAKWPIGKPAGKPAAAAPSSHDDHASCGCAKAEPGVCHCPGKSGEPSHPGAAASAEPDFAQMTRAEKLAYNQARRDRIFG